MYIICVFLQVDVEKPEEVRLIDLDETHGGEHTVFIMPPEEPQEPDGSECPALYRYEARGPGGSLCSSPSAEALVLFTVMKPSPP